MWLLYPLIKYVKTLKNNIICRAKEWYSYKQGQIKV